MSGDGRTVGHDDPGRGVIRPVDGAGAQPFAAAGLLDQRDGLAGEQCGGDRLDPLRIGDAPAGRRLVERQAEPQIAGRGDRGDPAGYGGDGAGDRVGAVMPADQRHRDRAVLGYRDDRRLRCFAASSGATARIRMPLAQIPTIGRPAAKRSARCVETRS